MLDRIRDVLYRAISTPAGDSVAPVRIPKDLARRLNATLGQPLAPKEELARRSQARARLENLRATGPTTTRPRTESPPVLVYFEEGRSVRELKRIEELLVAKAIVWKRFDVSGDEATLEFVARQAHCERDDLPVVFVADRAIGGYDALVRADVSGELERLVNGA
jgi:hypothetical protein